MLRAGQEQASFLRAGLLKEVSHWTRLSVLLRHILYQLTGHGHAVDMIQSCIYLSYTPEGVQAIE